MNAIVTGTNGTVAPVLVQTLRQHGHTVAAWDRSRIATDNLAAMRQFFEETMPDWFFHVATGDPAWAASVARLSAEYNVKFLFTSSVSVFSGSQQGPVTTDVMPQPDDDYGRYKYDCEQRVQAENQSAQIVRLGWQIGTSAGGNHMLDHLLRLQREQGHIDGSINWFQACSFLDDTANGLLSVIANFSAGIYHLDSNRGLSFFEIVNRLNQLYGNGSWQVRPTEEPVHNNLLMDPQLSVPSLAIRLQHLA